MGDFSHIKWELAKKCEMSDFSCKPLHISSEVECFWRMGHLTQFLSILAFSFAMLGIWYFTESKSNTAATVYVTRHNMSVSHQSRPVEVPVHPATFEQLNNAWLGLKKQFLLSAVLIELQKAREINGQAVLFNKVSGDWLNWWLVEPLKGKDRKMPPKNNLLLFSST